MQLPGIRGKGRTIMGEPENEAQQPTPDPAQPDQPEEPDEGGAQPEPEPPAEPDEGGAQPDITWHG